MNNHIDLNAIIRKALIKKRLILTITSAFFIISLLLALLNPKEYNVNVSILPEFQKEMNSTANFLQKFESITNIDPDDLITTDALYPDIYPDILSTTPFYRHLLSSEFYLSNGNIIEFRSYLEDQLKQDVFGFVINSLISLKKIISGSSRDSLPQVDSNIIQNSFEDKELIEILSKRISASFDDQSGKINVSVLLQDPLLSAQVANVCIEYLKDYIGDYRTEKAIINLNFILERKDFAYQEYIEAENKLARFRDENINIRTAIAKSKEQHLINNHNLYFSLYKELSGLAEQAKIKVEERTPVLKILEPPVVPLEKSKPKRILTMFLGIILGVFISFCYIFFEDIRQIYRTEKTESNNHN